MFDLLSQSRSYLCAYLIVPPLSPHSLKIRVSEVDSLEEIYKLFVLQSLLDEPNPNSPANSLAAQLYQENKREYEKRVATVVEQSWLNFQESHTEDPR